MAVKRSLHWAVEESPASLILHIRGDVDPQTVPEFAHAIRETLARGKTTLIDLTGVTYFDGEGIGILREQATLAKATLRLPGQVRRMLESLHIDYLFRLQ